MNPLPRFLPSSISQIAMATALALTPIASTASDANAVARLELRRGDRIVFVGNTFGERFVQAGYFETLLAAHLPEKFLTLRNLSWSGDTLDIRLRPLNFGDQHTHLEQQEADVIFLCYGMNESYAGEPRLAAFSKALSSLIDSLRAHNYNGESPPRLVLVSPIPHENLGGLFPDPAPHNDNLRVYTKAMHEVGTDKRVPVVDLFTPLAKEMKASVRRLTINGIHLNDYGNWVAALAALDQLGIAPSPARVRIDARSATVEAKAGSAEKLNTARDFVRFDLREERLPAPPPPPGAAPPVHLLARHPELTVVGLLPGRYALRIDDREVWTAEHTEWAQGLRLTSGPAAENTEELRKVVRSKNRQFFYRYRAVNGEYIYGRRKEPFGVVSFPPEMEKLDRIVDDHDRIIWDLSGPIRGHTFELVRVSK